MKKIIYLILVVLCFSLIISGCSNSNKLTGNVIQENLSNKSVENITNEFINNSCEDKCFLDSCNDTNFTSCEKQSDGCNDTINKGIVKGKCGVECINNSDCLSNQNCFENKCINISSGGSGGGGGSGPHKRDDCYSNDDCKDNEYCSEPFCFPVSCNCGQILNHTCIPYECCLDSDCGINETCENHKCENSSFFCNASIPLMQVFIMSHCPYGVQMVKGLLPVWQEFQDKANIELRFVSYIMHGEQEVLDNSRIVCIREEQNEKLLAYLNCYVYGDGTENNSQNCIVQTGINETELNDCLATNVTNYLEVDRQLNIQYDVQGSPTTILCGREVQVYPRDPQNIANILCSAFIIKPSECSLNFSTENPSPGFGGGGTNDSNNASCG